MPEGYPKIVHYYDIWHFIKVGQNIDFEKLFNKHLCLFIFQSILKDLWKASKLKSCAGRYFCIINNCFNYVAPDLGEWIPSVRSQLWFAFSSSIGRIIQNL